MSSNLQIERGGVYSLNWDNGFQPLTTSEHSVVEISDRGLARGARRATGWKRPVVRRSRDGEFAGLPAGEFPLLLPGLCVFLEPMAQTLAGKLPDTEVLGLDSADGESLAILHVTSFVDALDVERSDLIRFSSSGRVRSIKRAAFLGAKVAKATGLWRIPQDPYRVLVAGSDNLLAELRLVSGLSLRKYGAATD